MAQRNATTRGAIDALIAARGKLSLEQGVWAATARALADAIDDAGESPSAARVLPSLVRQLVDIVGRLTDSRAQAEELLKGVFADDGGA